MTNPVVSVGRNQPLMKEEIAGYDKDGYILLKGLISKESAEALYADVMYIMDQVGLGMSKLKQSSRYLAGSAIDSLVNSPDLRRIASELMGGPGTVYLPFTAVKSGGGGGRFHFHQDNQYTRHDGPGINMWFALSPMRVENGCLQVIPGSHRQGTLKADVLDDGHRMLQYEPKDFVSILMEPGDCIAFTRLTVHGSGPNNTPGPRVAYAVQFHRDDVSATWDGQQTPILLKAHPRFAVGPVAAIVAKDGNEEIWTGIEGAQP